MHFYRKYSVLSFPVLLFLWLCSCGESIPEGILDPEMFRPVLKEILIADSGVDTLPLSFKEKKAERERRYDLIYGKYGLTRETFLKNFEYYRERPEIMDVMYGQIIDELNEMMTQQQMPVNPTFDSSLKPQP